MILAILQARMSSNRLPGKVLMPIDGVPMLLTMVKRVSESVWIDKIIIATSIDTSDDPIAELCEQNEISCFRGDLKNVLDRFYVLANLVRPEHIVRLTGDCPFIPAFHIDNVIRCHIKGSFDYTRDYGFPDGWDTEVMTFDALCRAWGKAVNPYDLEHVTPFIYNNPDIFKLGGYDSKIDCSQTKLSIDTEEEYNNLCILKTSPLQRLF